MANGNQLSPQEASFELVRKLIGLGGPALNPQGSMQSFGMGVGREAARQGGPVLRELLSREVGDIKSLVAQVQGRRVITGEQAAAAKANLSPADQAALKATEKVASEQAVEASRQIGFENVEQQILSKGAENNALTQQVASSPQGTQDQQLVNGQTGTAAPEAQDLFSRLSRLGPLGRMREAFAESLLGDLQRRSLGNELIKKSLSDDDVQLTQEELEIRKEKRKRISETIDRIIEKKPLGGFESNTLGFINNGIDASLGLLKVFEYDFKEGTIGNPNALRNFNPLSPFGQNVTRLVNTLKNAVLRKESGAQLNDADLRFVENLTPRDKSFIENPQVAVNKLISIVNQLESQKKLMQPNENTRKQMQKMKREGIPDELIFELHQRGLLE